MRSGSREPDAGGVIFHDADDSARSIAGPIRYVLRNSDASGCPCASGHSGVLHASPSECRDESMHKDCAGRLACIVDERKLKQAI